MAYNPFLSMEEPAAPVTTEALNPFIMMDTQQEAPFTGDNPFSVSNPFSTIETNYTPEFGSAIPVDIFGSFDTQTLESKQFVELKSETGMAPINIFDTDNTEDIHLVKPTELELASADKDFSYSDAEFVQTSPPLRPLPQETQNLILSVTGQMEINSSHLLDRIPLTRTPSPVSVRDIQSPSPTPADHNSENVIEQAPITDNFDINRNKPVRPPPVRPPVPPVTRPPPPRPNPPPPKPPKTQSPSNPSLRSPSDDINLFDAPVPVVRKPTKEAILSLYSKPKQEEVKQIDFLSDDIVEDTFTPSEVNSSVPTNATLISSSELFSEHETMEAKITDAIYDSQGQSSNTQYFSESRPSKLDNIIPMDCNESQQNVNQDELIPSKKSSPFTEKNESYINRQYQEDKNPFEMCSTQDVFIATETTESSIEISKDKRDDTSIDLFKTEKKQNVFIPEEELENISNDAFNLPKEIIMNTSTSQNDTFEISQANDMNNGSKESESNKKHALPASQDAFDAFSAKFDSTTEKQSNKSAWGEENSAISAAVGFEADAFDTFLNMEAPPPPTATPQAELYYRGSGDSDDENISLFIKPKEDKRLTLEAVVPALAPPPRPVVQPESPRVNPFDETSTEWHQDQHAEPMQLDENGSGPPTPLFDDDVSMPLEEFPRTIYHGPGWEMHLRQPNKKKITGQRFWKKIFVRLVMQGDNPVVQLMNTAGDKEPFQELPLQACYSVSDIAAQQFDQYGKIFTVKLQYVFYKERPGVRPGQVTKAERITNKLSQFAAYAIQGDYQGVKEFGSDLRKLGLPVEHAPQVSQLFKLGSLSYEDVKQFSCSIEEALFKLSAHRDRALAYKMEEVQITAVDELYVEQDAEGGVIKQIARVRLFFLGFLSGMPDVELGVNDLRRQGKEVVGRHDIIPVVTEEWIRVEEAEFHACVQPEEFTKTQIIRFKPPDACYIELMRFRVRPPKNRELPLQLKAVWCVTGNKVELRADVLVPGFASRKLGQVPCEDVAIRFPIPECWIYLFRIEKHFRYGSVKSAHRRTGKIKGIERILGAVETLQESLIEVTSGQAKYEHQHRAIVWRMPRLPKEGQGAYTTHNLVCRMALTSYDQVPEQLAPHAFVEFTMPATQVSHTTVRSVSLQNYDNDPPEKYVRYLARHEYIVGIERTSGTTAPAYSLAAVVEAKPEKRPEPPTPTPATPAAPSSGSDSD